MISNALMPLGKRLVRWPLNGLAVLIPMFALAQAAIAQEVACALPTNVDTANVDAMHDLAGGDVLIQAGKGLFLAHAADGAVTISEVATEKVGDVNATYDMPGSGVLIGAENGWFLLRGSDGAVTAAHVEGPEIGGTVLGSSLTIMTVTPASGGVSAPSAPLSLPAQK
jgi:hypothetical protein